MTGRRYRKKNLHTGHRKQHESRTKKRRIVQKENKGVFANQPILRTGNPLGSYADFYYPVMTMGQLRALRTKAKSHAINNLVNSNVQSLRENLKPQPCHVIALSIQQGLGLRFSRKDLTLG